MIPINCDPLALKSKSIRTMDEYVKPNFTFSFDLINRFQNGLLASFFFNRNSQWLWLTLRYLDVYKQFLLKVLIWTNHLATYLWIDFIEEFQCCIVLGAFRLLTSVQSCVMEVLHHPHRSIWLTWSEVLLIRYWFRAYRCLVRQWSIKYDLSSVPI